MATRKITTLAEARKIIDTQNVKITELSTQLAARERAVRKDYEWILEEIVAWGMQVKTYELDLTTAEFGEIWRSAQTLLKRAKETHP